MASSSMVHHAFYISLYDLYTQMNFVLLTLPNANVHGGTVRGILHRDGERSDNVDGIAKGRRYRTTDALSDKGADFRVGDPASFFFGTHVLRMNVLWFAL